MSDSRDSIVIATKLKVKCRLHSAAVLFTPFKITLTKDELRKVYFRMLFDCNGLSCSRLALSEVSCRIYNYGIGMTPHGIEFIPNLGNMGRLVRKVTQEKYGKVEWLGGIGAA